MNKTFKLSIQYPFVDFIDAALSYIRLSILQLHPGFEAVGGKVDATMMVFSRQNVSAKGIAAISVLNTKACSRGSTDELRRKAVGNAKLYLRAAGGNFSMKSSFDYKPMKRSELLSALIQLRAKNTRSPPKLTGRWCGIHRKSVECSKG